MKRAILFTIMMSFALLISACSNKTDEPAAESQPESTAESEEAAETMEYDFEQFSNVNITGIDISSLNGVERAVLYTQARYFPWA